MFAKYFWVILNFNSHVHLFFLFWFCLLPLQRTTSLFHWLLVSFLICINSSLIQNIPSLHSFQFPLPYLYSPPPDQLQTPSFPREEQSPRDSHQSENNKIQHVWYVYVCYMHCTCLVCVYLYIQVHTQLVHMRLKPTY